MKSVQDYNKEHFRAGPNSEKIEIHLDRTVTWDQRKKISQNYTFYLNKDFISEVLDVDNSKIYPIKNDWQDELMVPELKNHLEILPRCPGIFPTESII